MKAIAFFSRNKYRLGAILGLFALVSPLLLNTPKAAAALVTVTIQVSATSTDANAPTSATFTVKPESGSTNTTGVTGSVTITGKKSGANTTYIGAISGAKIQSGEKYQICSADLGNLCSDLFASGSIPTPVTISSSTNGGNKSASTKCEDLGGLAWIACPIVSAVDAITSFLDSKVQDLLMVDPKEFNNAAFKNAWATIRNIALIILVPIMIVMVIGTALDTGPFDAYTVKKAMPRLVAAVLFIVLSYSICIYAVEFTNALGTGILGLLTSAVGQDGPITLDTITGGMTSGIGQWMGIILGVGAVVVGFLSGALTFGICFSFGLVTILALFIGFVILILRQVVILGLVLFAPIAILSWIFPGNDKIWNVWKTSFTRLLLMFPLITLLIGSGRVFAYIINLN